ncbi:hypothetical protein MBLNU457_g0389t1 [Dothideomycetes sp. NU457]
MTNAYYPGDHPLAKVDVAYVIDRLYDANEKENIKWIACGCNPTDEWRLKYCLGMAYPDAEPIQTVKSIAMKLLTADEEGWKRYEETIWLDCKASATEIGLKYWGL